MVKWIPLAEVPSRLPPRSRGPVSLSTIERWTRYGICGGIKLKSYFVGSQEVTTQADLDAFIRDVTAHKLSARTESTA